MQFSALQTPGTARTPALHSAPAARPYVRPSRRLHQPSSALGNSTCVQRQPGRAYAVLCEASTPAGESSGGPVPHGAASVAAAALHEQLRCLNTEIAETVQLGDAAFKQLSLALKRRSNPQLCEALQSRYEHLCEREKRLNEMRSDIAGQLAVLAKGPSVSNNQVPQAEAPMYPSNTPKLSASMQGWANGIPAPSGKQHVVAADTTLSIAGTAQPQPAQLARPAQQLGQPQPELSTPRAFVQPAVPQSAQPAQQQPAQPAAQPPAQPVQQQPTQSIQPAQSTQPPSAQSEPGPSIETTAATAAAEQPAVDQTPASTTGAVASASTEPATQLKTARKRRPLFRKWADTPEPSPVPDQPVKTLVFHDLTAGLTKDSRSRTEVTLPSLRRTHIADFRALTTSCFQPNVAISPIKGDLLVADSIWVVHRDALPGKVLSKAVRCNTLLRTARRTVRYLRTHPHNMSGEGGEAELPTEPFLFAQATLNAWTDDAAAAAKAPSPPPPATTAGESAATAAGTPLMDGGFALPRASTEAATDDALVVFLVRHVDSDKSRAVTTTSEHEVQISCPISIFGEYELFQKLPQNVYVGGIVWVLAEGAGFESFREQPHEPFDVFAVPLFLQQYKITT